MTLLLDFDHTLFDTDRFFWVNVRAAVVQLGVDAKLWEETCEAAGPGRPDGLEAPPLSARLDFDGVQATLAAPGSTARPEHEVSSDHGPGGPLAARLCHQVPEVKPHVSRGPSS